MQSNREAKDKYIFCSGFKNAPAGLRFDINHGPDIALPQLLMYMASLQMAKYGMAYHSPKEDLYCFIGKTIKKTQEILLEFYNQMSQRINRERKWNWI